MPNAFDSNNHLFSNVQRAALCCSSQATTLEGYFLGARVATLVDIPVVSPTVLRRDERPLPSIPAVVVEAKAQVVLALRELL